jgi:hypothetical protein
MNWSRILLGGAAAGVVTWLADFVMHGLILGGTYQRYPQVFSQTQKSPAWFLLVSVCIGLTVALLLAKTRSMWAAGAKGGATYGFFLGLVGFFPSFYYPLVIDGMPYFLAWCWGGITLIDSVLAGAVLGTIIKRA